MKKIQLLAIIIVALHTVAFAQTSHTITTSGFTFVPATVSANVGDTIIFNVNFSMHPTQQVSSATWTADQSTALSGGFASAASVIMTQPGTVYYVCKMHVASYGMKGTVVVAGSNGIENLPSATTTIYPNPADKELSISPASSGYFTFSIIDMFGRTVSASSGYVAAKDVFKANVSAIAQGDYTIVVNSLDGKTSRSKIAIRH